MGAPVSAQKAEHLGREGQRSKCEQSSPTASDVAGLFLVSDEGSLAALDTGATADSVYCWWLQRQNRLLGKKGRQKVSTCPSSARGRFRDGRLDDVRHAADFPACISGSQGNFAAFALDADIAELSRKGALEALGGQLDFLRDPLTLRKRGATIPARVDGVGRYLLGAVDFGADASRRVRGLVVLASDFEWTFTSKRPNFSNRQLHVPHAEDGPYQFEPLRAFTARRAAALGDASDGCPPDP